MNTLTDNAIMLRIKAGDLEKMGLLFERHHRSLYGFLFHMTYNREGSEDMVQTTFYKMLKYRNTFTGDGEFTAWMYQIARNILKDSYKKIAQQARHYDVEEFADRLDGGTAADEQLEIKQTRSELHGAMENLSSDYREVLIMSRFQELKHQEIAQILQVTEGAVKVRVHRAMQELKNVYLKRKR
ncbi:RNA polymerase sigma factor [Mucilaginibacter sabulilitoris]|uniref:RNA polymerase sigma factor n=1 Tax=Mucilaginibacter sabulilitoris TaxID=1173583 RepID=A0ABZ0TGU3_9SPHI|nr:RNA polymerase sigma factor [Mucilaginibacter sabulilitoris]WPU91989.1 RNA polymerase sigma factor [Mucilaginibacter sabulilitoris]